VKWQIRTTDTLHVHRAANQAELSKLSPLGKTISSDGNQETDHEQIVRINAAYEVLGDAVGSLTTSNCRLVRLLPGVSDNSKRQIPKTISRLTTKGRDADEQQSSKFINQSIIC